MHKLESFYQNEVNENEKLLLTGFEPFLEFPVNPTTDITNELHQNVIGDFEITGEILTVDFQKTGTQLVDLIKNTSQMPLFH